MSQLPKHYKFYLDGSQLVPSQQVLYLYNIIEHPEAAQSDRQWALRHIRSIQNRLINPSPRQKVIGFRRGGVSNREKLDINLCTQMQNMKSLLME